MDAVKFMKEYNRMCKSYFDNEECEGCEGCPLKNRYCFETFLPPTNKISYEDVTNTVEAWSKGHPKEYKGKKFIIEIDGMADMAERTFRVKGTALGLSRETLDKLEEYKEREE